MKTVFASIFALLSILTLTVLLVHDKPSMVEFVLTVALFFATSTIGALILKGNETNTH